MIKEILDAVGIHAALTQEVKDHPGIERAATRAHREAVERGEAHRGVDALAVAHRAKAGPGAKMGGDDPPPRDGRGALSQGRRDVIVGKAVEPVPLDPGVVQLAGQGEALRDRRLVMMESGIEARDLRERR